MIGAVVSAVVLPIHRVLVLIKPQLPSLSKNLTEILWKPNSKPEVFTWVSKLTEDPGVMGIFAPFPRPGSLLKKYSAETIVAVVCAVVLPIHSVRVLIKPQLSSLSKNLTESLWNPISNPEVLT